MNHVVLLGDSVFDNWRYVGDGSPVIVHLENLLPESWKATLLAVDGSTARDVIPQLERLPADATHLIISAGGNDALQQAGILRELAQSVAGVLLRLDGIAAEFERDYQETLGAALEKDRATALCTIYNPFFGDQDVPRAAAAALPFFNDRIIRAAARHGLPVLDLRLVCNEPTDYAEEIEPSDAGGLKIAQAIHRLLAEHDFSRPRASIFA